MRTNRNLYILFVLFILLPTLSCDSILEEESYGLLTPELTITSPSDLRSAVDGIYQTLKDSYGDRYSVLSLNWLASEIVTTPQGGSEGELDRYRVEATNEILDNIFQTNYDGIKRANTVLEYADKIEFSNEEEKSKITGEAKFMRAFYYFTLVRLFGPLPIHLTVPKSPDEVHLSRSPVQTIYDEIIIPDLNFAIAHLPENVSDSRANMTAAQVLLGKVYMTLEKWNEALLPVQSVINSGNYNLTEDWSELWNDPNENVEIILAIQYINVPEQMNVLSPFFGINAGGGIGNPFYHAELPYYENYPDGPRKNALFLIEHVEPSGDTIRIGDPNWAQGWQKPLFKCYMDPEPSVIGHGIDIPLLRYADVLLMYAEILNEINGPTLDAYEAINKVRRRAAGEIIDLESDVDLKNLDKVEFRNAVFQERRWELPLEGHSWFDAVRVGLVKFQEVMAASETDIEQVVDPIEDYRLLMPFPSFEIQRNNKLDFSDQNPGY